jgi:hypothetical protein
MINNSYQGYFPMIFDVESVIRLLVFSFLLGFSIPSSIEKPSDIFQTIYIVIVLVSCLLFFNVSKSHSFSFFYALFSILYLPIFLIKVFKKWNISIKKIKIISNTSSNFILMLIFLISILLSYIMGGHLGSFEYASIYDRRVEGRDIFIAGSLISYVFSLAINGILNYFSFLTGYKSSLYLFLASLFFSVFCFWLLGLKSPILYFVFFWVLGVIMRKQKLPFRFHFLLVVINLALLLAIIEFALSSNGFSITSQVVVRRIFIIQGEIQSFYFNAFMNSNWKEMLFGLDYKGYGDVTYFIGDKYLDNNLTNADTNTFLYYLLKFGFLGYLFCVFCVVFFFILLDSLFKNDFIEKKGSYFFLSILFGLLILEQSFSVVFISSGVLFLFLLTFFSYSKRFN